MTIRFRTRKIERSAADKARIKAFRARFQRDKPSLDELEAQRATVVSLGTYVAVQQLLAELRQVRQKQQLTLEQVAERAGMDKAAISRLETGKQPNPTVDSLFRVATALGKTIGLRLEGARPKRGRSKKAPV